MQGRQFRAWPGGDFTTPSTAPRSLAKTGV
jgi:hypothetical protein